MIESRLLAPPDYEYKSRGPWFVLHANDAQEAWIKRTLESAVYRFWSCGEIPQQRLLVDGNGVTILGTTFSPGGERARMVGTRESMDLTLEMTQSAPGSAMEDVTSVLAIIECIRQAGGDLS